MTPDYQKIGDHLRHMHAGLVSLRDSIPKDTRSSQAIMLRCSLTVAADKIEEMAIRSLQLHFAQEEAKVR